VTADGNGTRLHRRRRQGSPIRLMPERIATSKSASGCLPRATAPRAPPRPAPCHLAGSRRHLGVLREVAEQQVDAAEDLSSPCGAVGVATSCHDPRSTQVKEILVRRLERRCYAPGCRDGQQNGQHGLRSMKRDGQHDRVGATEYRDRQQGENTAAGSWTACRNTSPGVRLRDSKHGTWASPPKQPGHPDPGVVATLRGASGGGEPRLGQRMADDRRMDHADAQREGSDAVNGRGRPHVS
jgi:hypothetical protein